MTDKPPITFSLFVLSLAASAEVHLGTMAAPGSERPEKPNLVEASHLIEVLVMLKEKTSGNLDEREQQLMDGVLYDLRLLYVEAAAREKRVEP